MFARKNALVIGGVFVDGVHVVAGELKKHACVVPWNGTSWADAPVAAAPTSKAPTMSGRILRVKPCMCASALRVFPSAPCGWACLKGTAQGHSPYHTRAKVPKVL